MRNAKCSVFISPPNVRSSFMGETRCVSCQHRSGFRTSLPHARVGTTTDSLLENIRTSGFATSSSTQKKCLVDASNSLWTKWLRFLTQPLPLAYGKEIHRVSDKQEQTDRLSRSLEGADSTRNISGRLCVCLCVLCVSVSVCVHSDTHHTHLILSRASGCSRGDTKRVRPHAPLHCNIARSPDLCGSSIRE